MPWSPLGARMRGRSRPPPPSEHWPRTRAGLGQSMRHALRELFWMREGQHAGKKTGWGSRDQGSQKVVPPPSPFASCQNEHEHEHLFVQRLEGGGRAAQPPSCL